MSAKTKVGKDEILAAAVQLIRTGGAGALSMRNIARQLGCSTQPLYSQFGSQEQLYQELPGYIRERYLSLASVSYRELGRAFLRFAGTEPELFRFLYLRRRSPDQSPLEDANRERSLALLTASLELEQEEAVCLHRQMQNYCYGLGTMIATGYRVMDQEETDRELTRFFSLLVEHYKGVSRDEEIAYWLNRSRNAENYYNKGGFYGEEKDTTL